MKLIIVESPHKAKTISKYLGHEYKVIASKGHVRDLPEKKLAIDVKDHYRPEYVNSPGKEETISMLKREVAKAEKVYLAGDPDREGEAISWHIANVCGIDDDNSRIEFNEISKKAVNRALENPRPINMGLVDAQQARRVLDRLVGYELSPVISRKIKSGLSAGRVQSVALKMAVDREREIRAFVPEEYWTIVAKVTKSGQTAIFKCDFADVGGKKTKVGDKEHADAIIAASKSGEWYVDGVKRAKSVSRPNPPFTTSTMQQDAIAKLNFSAATVTSLAQKLYEGVEVAGEGQIALVTYIRSDSVRVSSDAQKEALAHIGQNFGVDYVPEKPNFYGTSSQAQDAHEAIRPITVERTPDSLKDKIGRNEYRLYKLIYDRFVASQMAPAVYDTLTVHVVSEADGVKYGYTLKGKVTLFDGFTAAYKNGEDDDAKDKTLPEFSEGEPLKCKDVTGEQKFTKPPLRYTDGSFIKAMEEHGIGRPSTFEKTISTIVKRNYVEKEGKYLKATELGELVCDQLIKYFPNIMDFKFTATMETDLDKIEDGNVKWYDVVDAFYPEFHQKILAANADGTKVKPKEEETDVVCEKCGANMVIRESRYGKFLACPNFPKCRNTKPLADPVAKCPACGGEVFKKISKKGKVFYSCNNYPACNFMSWDVPAPYYCPDCHGVMKIVEAKDGGKKYVCTNKDCKHTEVFAPDSGDAERE